MTEILRATTSFRAGQSYVRAGELYNADDPVVQGREELFEPAGGAVRSTTAPAEPPASAVRTTATTPEPATAPPPFVPSRPAKDGKKVEWVEYVASFEGVDRGDVEGLTIDELRSLADDLEAGDGS